MAQVWSSPRRSRQRLRISERPYLKWLIITSICFFLLTCTANAQTINQPLITPLISPQTVITEDLTSTSSISAYITQKAQENDISPELANYIIKHESGYNCSQIGDMNIYRKGRPVRARGCWQITQYYHPEVTDAQAFDLIWSTNWAMNILKNKKLCMSQFSTCADYYNKVQLTLR